MVFSLGASRVASTSRCLLPRQMLSSALQKGAVPLSAVPSAHNPIPSEVRHLSKKARAPQVGLSKEQKRQAQLRKVTWRRNRAIKAELQAQTKPDPVLGYRPGNSREAGVNDEALWESCELKQVILTKEDVWGVKVDRRGTLVDVDSPRAKGSEHEQAIAQQFGGPARLNYGYTQEDRALLFKSLPETTTEDRIVHSDVFSKAGGLNQTTGVSQASAKAVSLIEEQEQTSTDRLGRILDLKNASGKGIDVENKRRILEQFQSHDNDVGGVEAQVALMTYRLHLLHEHLSQGSFRKDNVTRRSMALLVHKRARLLKYFKKQNADKYYKLLSRIGVNARAVEGEIIVPSRPPYTGEQGL